MATKTNTSINGKDYYRIQRVVGERDGKPVRKSFYGKSKAEAEDKYDRFKEEQIRAQYERRQSVDLSTFSERAEEYIENALKPSARYAQGTIQRYESAYRTHISKSSLSGMVASKIKAADIQKFYNGLDVSMQTLRQVHRFMSALFKWMQRNEYSDNVLLAVELPKKPDNRRVDDIVTWSEEEIAIIEANIGEHRLRFLIYVMLYTGARIGEAIALEYSDFNSGVLHIKRQVYEGEVKAPKADSKRDIPVHPVLKRELHRHRKWHEAEMEKNNYATDCVFTTESGRRLDPRNTRRSLKRFYERAGVEPKHPHAYRSTFCTQLCKCGVPLEVASKLLGHKSIEVTAKHYAQVQPKTKKEAIMQLDYGQK